MAKRGRPPQPVPQDKADSIVEWIATGKTLREWCRQKDNPAWTTVYAWLEKDQEFAERFARARVLGEQAISEQCLEIADEHPPSNDEGRTDAGYVAWQKNRIWTRTQLLAKWNPKKWGDKVDVTSDGKAVGLAINIDLNERTA